SVQFAPVRAASRGLEDGFNYRKIRSMVLLEVLVDGDITGGASVIGGQPGCIRCSCSDLEWVSTRDDASPKQSPEFSQDLWYCIKGQRVFHFVKAHPARRYKRTGPMFAFFVTPPGQRA